MYYKPPPLGGEWSGATMRLFFFLMVTLQGQTDVGSQKTFDPKGPPLGWGCDVCHNEASVLRVPP